MGKRIFLVHGWGATPEKDFWPWLKDELESKGLETIAPEMPDTDEPKIEPWVGKLSEVVSQLDENTYFVGHSVGCQTILRYLESVRFSRRIGGVILVAPWMHLDDETIKEEGEEVIEIAAPWMETPIDFGKVKGNCKDFVCIFSDNDPFVPLSDRDIFRELLSAKIITEHDKGHFSEGDGIKEVPVVLEELLKIVKQ